ncbi:MAG: PH domain-containing protein [Verrucomicrobiota bacterium]
MNFLRPIVLRWLRIPPEPAPPAGAPGSLRVFRAGARYLQWRRALWILRQAGTVAGAAVGVILLRRFLQRTPEEFQSAGWWGLDASHLLGLAEALGLLGLLLQMPFTYALLQLDYELRWYLVTDRSLRLREGLTRIRELTLSFANIQQITVQQGPLQRLLGLADVVVTTAGGGGAAGPGPDAAAAREATHTGVFRCVDNAAEIRDLMLERLRQFRDSGLGDVDDAAPSAEPGDSPIAGRGTDPVLEAAREALTEARALRRRLTGGDRA